MEANLARFIAAQRDTYDVALAEITAGRKSSHWMWFIFPQLKGLGRTETARFYGIDELAEATAYLNHPVLGPRLVRLCQILIAVPQKSAHAIFGSPDDLKLRSCMTLFSHVQNADPVFSQVLQKFFEGDPDHKTLSLLSLAD